MKERVEDALCPRCGTTKPPRAGECPNCGVVYAKYEAAVRRRQLAPKPAPRTRHGLDWNRLPLYLFIAAALVAISQSGRIWNRALKEVDDATSINSPATRSEPLALLAFACAPGEDGVMLARGAVQNRSQRGLSPGADIVWTDRHDGLDRTLHAEAATDPEQLAPLAIASFTATLRGAAGDIGDCHVAAFAERSDGTALAFIDSSH